MWVYIIICSLAAATCQNSIHQIGGGYTTKEKCELEAIKQGKLLYPNSKDTQIAFFCSYLTLKE